MKFNPTEIPAVILVEPDVFKDARGFFLESYHEEKYRAGGIQAAFVQDNHSCSVKATLRGLHAQRRHPQGKLVRVIKGEVFDVAVDIRPNSPTFKRWISATLSAENFRQLYIPPGFAHGFCVLSETAEFEYKCTDFYRRDDELAIRWDDPEIGIVWPVKNPILSDKDRGAPLLRDALG
jgi:dTDP-4-dehydrorhamnose 3,5-epimerase